MEDINMSKKKKGLGGLLGLAALAGGVAAVVSYLYKYLSNESSSLIYP